MLPVLNGVVVQSYGFRQHLPVGKPEIAAEFLNSWGIDEIVCVDIRAGIRGDSVSPEMIQKVSSRCFAPLTAGGGINKIEQADRLIHSGADKLCFNRIFFENPAFIKSIASKYGDQCVVISIDALKSENDWKVYDYASGTTRKESLQESLKMAEEAGAGEIILNAVHKDGSFEGFDIPMFQEACRHVNVPLLACGGARNGFDFVKLFKETSVSAGCAGNFFNFSEHSVNVTKKILAESGIDIRIEVQSDYSENQISPSARLLKKDEDALEQLLYVKIEKEVI
jgi:cyclase